MDPWPAAVRDVTTASVVCACKRRGGTITINEEGTHRQYTNAYYRCIMRYRPRGSVAWTKLVVRNATESQKRFVLDYRMADIMFANGEVRAGSCVLSRRRTIADLEKCQTPVCDAGAWWPVATLARPATLILEPNEVCVCFVGFCDDATRRRVVRRLVNGTHDHCMKTSSACRYTGGILKIEKT